MKFKVGDRVRVINGNPPWSVDGDTGTVKKVDKGGYNPMIVVRWDDTRTLADSHHFDYRFELVEDEPVDEDETIYHELKLTDDQVEAIKELITSKIRSIDNDQQFYYAMDLFNLLKELG